MRVAERSHSKPGLIDVLSLGFDAINHSLWIVAIPMLLDLFLWRGPHITPLPLFQKFMDWYQASLSGAEVFAPNGQRVEELRQTAEAAAASFNMLSLLVTNFVANVPNTTAGRPADTTLVLSVGSEAGFALLFVFLELAGLALGCLYLGLIAQQVRDGRVDLRRLAAKLGSYFGSALALGLLILAVALALIVPLTGLFVASLFLGAGAVQAALGLVVTAIYFATIWALLYLFFASDAIVVSEVGATRAILLSVLVVGKNFWSSLGLILLTLLILSGTQVIWSSISYSPWGVMAGVLGNAYVASGLTAAGMLFYRSRIAGLEENGNYQQRFLRRK